MQMGIGSKPLGLQSVLFAPAFIPKGGGSKISRMQYRRLKEQMASIAPMGEKQSFKQPSRRRLSRRRSGFLSLGGPRAGLTRVGLDGSNGTTGTPGCIETPSTDSATSEFGLGFPSRTCGQQFCWPSKGRTRVCDTVACMPVRPCRPGWLRHQLAAPEVSH